MVCCRIAAVVEGHGEVNALPILLRRICESKGYYSIDYLKPHRLSRSSMMMHKVGDAVRLQRNKVGSSGVVVVLYDSDDDSPEFAVEETSRFIGSQSDNVVVAVAVREYEAWFLASIESLRTHKLVKDDAVYFGNPESRRDAKGALGECMTESYRETRHQSKFSARFDLEAARLNSPSFARFEALVLEKVGERVKVS